MNRLFITLSLFIISIAISATEIQTKCIRQHLKDAIKINKKRRPLYKALTDGKSKKLSNSLIFSEKLSLSYAFIFDLSAKKYQKRGIPLFCLDFIDMKEIADFQAGSEVPEYKYESLEKINTKEIIANIKKSLKKRSFKGVQDYMQLELKNFEEEKKYNCLAKHVLESIQRSAFLAPHYIQASEMIGMKSPKKLLENNIKIQAMSLKIFSRIDKKAAKFQEEGVSIICNDIPHIPIPSEAVIDSIYSNLK